MLSFITASTSTNFTSRTEHVLNHCSIVKFLKLSFQRVVIHPNWTPNKRVTPFWLHQCKLSRLISECVTPNDLVVTPCTDLLKCWISMHWKEDLVELLKTQIFLFCKSLNMRLILMKAAVFILAFWRCWRSYFHLSLLTHGSDSSCLQNNSKAQSTPEVTVGNTHSMLTNQRHLNLWHN
jgi:hypothetical protein